MSAPARAHRPWFEIEDERRALIDEITASDGEVTPEQEARLSALDAEICERADAYAWTVERVEAERRALLDRSRALGRRAIACQRVVDRLRARMAGILLSRGVSRLEGQDYVLVLQRTASVEVDDLSAVPSQYLRQRPPEPNREAIGRALRSGQEVPGARLVEHPYVLIR